MLRIALLILTINTALASYAYANEITQEFKTAIEELFIATNNKQEMDQTIEAMYDQFMAPFAKAPCSDGLAKNLKPLFMKNLSFEAQKPYIIKLYAEKFSANDIKEITRWYKTPLGQKALKEMPAIAKASIANGQVIAQKMIPEIQTATKQYFSENEQCLKAMKEKK